MKEPCGRQKVFLALMNPSSRLYLLSRSPSTVIWPLSRICQLWRAFMRGKGARGQIDSSGPKKCPHISCVSSSETTSTLRRRQVMGAVPELEYIHLGASGNRDASRSRWPKKAWNSLTNILERGTHCQSWTLSPLTGYQWEPWRIGEWSPAGRQVSSPTTGTDSHTACSVSLHLLLMRSATNGSGISLRWNGKYHPVPHCNGMFCIILV